MTPFDLITRRQYLEEELVLAAATHQYVLDGPSPTRPADRDARERPPRPPADPLDQHARLPEETHRPRPRRRPRMAGPRPGAGEARRRALRRTRRRGAARTTAAGPAEAALRAAVEQAERALFDDEGCYSVSKTHDAALDLAQAARALLNELETRHTE